MNYADIIKALPQDVADTLHAELDKQPFSPELSRDEVLELIEDAVKMTRLRTVIEDDEKRRMVDTLLGMFASAALQVVFA